MESVSSFAIPVAFDLSATSSDNIYRLAEATTEGSFETPLLVEAQRDLTIETGVATDLPHIIRLDR